MAGRRWFPYSGQEMIVFLCSVLPALTFQTVFFLALRKVNIFRGSLPSLGASIMPMTQAQMTKGGYGELGKLGTLHLVSGN